MNTNITIGVTLLSLAAVVWAVASGIGAKREFMAECQQHQPKYQCTALWAASQPDTVTVYRKD